MNNEIERKFLLKFIPELDINTCIKYERYYIYSDGIIEIRVQSKNDRYELERKEKINDTYFKKYKLDITKNEFEHFKNTSNKCIKRDSYKIDENISIKFYHGIYEGLVRAEIEFDNIEEMNSYNLPEYIGKEITGTAMANDSKLIELNEDEFKYELEKINLS